jgi:hypothetical protein
MAATIVPPLNDTAASPRPTTACPNCGSTMVDAFCAKCGELQPSHRDLSLRAVAHEAAQEFAGVDGKIPRTLWALITKPGLLTREFIDGRRGRYSKPLSLFLVLNLVFFVIQPHTGMLRYGLSEYIGPPGDVNDGNAAELVAAKLARSREPRASYETRFDSTLADQKKSMLLFAVPVFAVAMAILFAGKKRYFVEHLVFSVHAYAFLLALLAVGIAAIFYTIGGWLMLASLLGLPVRRAEIFLNGEPVLITVVAVATVTYMTLAIRRAYGGSTRAAFGRAAVLTFVQMSLIIVYHDLLFFTSFYAT